VHKFLILRATDDRRHKLQNKLLTVLPGWEARPQSLQLIPLCCYWTSPWNK